MKTFQKLDSEKYFTSSHFTQSLASDHKSSKMKKLASLWSSFVTLVLFLSACVLAYMAFVTAPHWIPVLETWFHETTNYRHF